MASLAPPAEPTQLTPLAAEVLSGLTRSPKTLSPWLFYDERGSELFEQITQLPEYYVTRTERGIFAEHAVEIVACAAGPAPLAVLELGAGTASKTGLLLRAAVERQQTVDYYAIDVSASALMEAKHHLERELPGVRVHPRVANYTEGLGLVDAEGLRKLVLYIGSSIGNFEPADAAALLRGVRAELAPGDQLLLGADMVKDRTTLLDAYDDAQGVTAAFNRNVLHRLNRELGAGFAVERFAHQARWNERESRIEMHLASDGGMRVSLGSLGLSVNFVAGETIHTENSYKFTDGQVRSILESAGFMLRQTWKDAQDWFGVYLAEAG